MRSGVLLVPVLLVLAAAGCRDSGGGDDAPLRVDAVEVSPAAVTLAPGAAQRFSATAVGVAGVSSAVTWSIFPYGAGSIDADGTYHAPDVSPLGSVQVRAVSSVDPSVSGEAVVTFTPRAVEVSPATVEVVLGQSTTFSAAVTGAVDPSVAWTASPGSIDADGVYQAPIDDICGTVTGVVRATSTATGAQGTATVLFRVAAPVLEALSGPRTAGETLTLTGSGLAPSCVAAATRVHFTAAGGGSIAVTPDLRTDTDLTVTVPIGAASGPVVVELDGGEYLGTATSNPLPFTRVPRLRMHSERSDLASGESTRLPVAFLGAPGPVAISYELDAGSVTGDVYTAPTVSETTYVNVRACVTGTTNCSGSTLAVHPFRVEPVPALVAAGGTLALQAESASGPIPANFTLVSGGGALTPSGLYTPSAGLAGAGQAWVVARQGGAERAVQVGVTGQVPGLLHRMVDYVDHRTIDGAIGAPRGSYVEALAVGGNRAYVAASHPLAWYSSRTYDWIDVYDIADPLRPVWLGAVESMTRPLDMFVAAGHLYAWSESDWSHDFARTLAVYDLSGSLPAAEALDLQPQFHFRPWAPPVSDGSRLFVFGGPETDLSVPLQVHSLDEGGFAPPREVVLRLGPGADVVSLEGMTAGGDRAFAVYMDGSGDRWLAAWNLAADPPAVLGVVAGGGRSLELVGSLLVSAGSLFDVTSDVPSLVRTVPYAGTVVAGAGDRLVLSWSLGGFCILDVADPLAPTVSALVYTGAESSASGAFVGDVLYAAEGFGGLAMFDVASPGAPIRTGLSGSISAYELAVQDGFLYGVGADPLGGGSLTVWDLSATPATISAALALDDAGYALSVDAGRLLVGTPTELQLWSLVQPELPAMIASVPLDVTAVQLVGDVAWVGTRSGDLVAFDLTIPEVPVELGRLPLGAPPFTLDLLAPGALAVGVASSLTGDLIVVDVTTPSAPVEGARAGLTIPIYSAARLGDTLLLATAAGLVTVDVQDPAHPIPLVNLPMLGAPYGETYDAVPTYAVGVGQGLAWVGAANARAAIHGYDVSNPWWPREVSRSAQGSVAWTSVLSFAFDGTRGFAGLENRVAEFDMTQPRNVVMTMAADPALQK